MINLDKCSNEQCQKETAFLLIAKNKNGHIIDERLSCSDDLRHNFLKAFGSDLSCETITIRFTGGYKFNEESEVAD